jgi:intracellular septation protein A
MSGLFHSLRALAADMASTIVFLVAFLITKDPLIATGAGVGFGLLQFAWLILRKQRPDVMQWLSLFLVIASGAATFLTKDPRFVMIKPSAIYVIIGCVMLKRGWMTRYMPPIAQQHLGDIADVYGYVWAALMFVSAALNIAIALNTDALTWATTMSTYGLVSKLGLFAIQYLTMRIIGRRRLNRSAGAGAVPA